MGVSFAKLWEMMDQPVGDDDLDSKAMEAIRIGINIREDFWDDFLQLINDSSALSDLLGIEEAKISGWHARIKEHLDKVQSSDDVPDEGKKELLGTGDIDLEPEGPVTMMDKEGV